MSKIKIVYLALILMLCVGLAAFDLYNFEYVLLPIFVVIQFICFAPVLINDRFRALIKPGILSIIISISTLALGGMVGAQLNELNRKEAMQIIAILNEFKRSNNRYPENLSEVPTWASVGSTNRLPSRARYFYKVIEGGNSYFLEMQSFPIGFVKWNPATRDWEDELL